VSTTGVLLEYSPTNFLCPGADAFLRRVIDQEARSANTCALELIWKRYDLLHPRDIS